MKCYETKISQCIHAFKQHSNEFLFFLTPNLLVCLYNCLHLSVFPNNFSKIYLIKLKNWHALSHDNTFRHIIFQISVSESKNHTNKIIKIFKNENYQTGFKGPLSGLRQFQATEISGVTDSSLGSTSVLKKGISPKTSP